MDRNELRRLQKAARDNNKFALAEWATRFEEQIRSDLDRFYKQKYDNDLLDTIDVFLIAIVYTLHFSEETRLGRKRLPEFLIDLMATIDLFRTGEYNAEEYKEELEKNGIKFETYQFDKLKNSTTRMMSLKRGDLQAINDEIVGKALKGSEDNEQKE